MSDTIEPTELRCDACQDLDPGDCQCGGCILCDPPYTWDGDGYPTLDAVRAAIGDYLASQLPDGDVLHEKGWRYGIRVKIELVCK